MNAIWKRLANHERLIVRGESLRYELSEGDDGRFWLRCGPDAPVAYLLLAEAIAALLEAVGTWQAQGSEAERD